MLKASEKEAFLNTFDAYNAAVWPYAILTYILAVAVVALIIRKRRHAGTVVSAILALLWGFAGVVLLMGYLGPIKPLWYLSGVLWLFQSLVFLKAGVMQKALTFQAGKDLYSVYGFLLILYGVAIYTVIGVLAGNKFPWQGPMFGTACCPVTIFTFGVLLTADRKVPAHIMVFPLIWSVGGIMAVIQYGVVQDMGLFVAGITGFPLILRKNAWLSAGC